MVSNKNTISNDTLALMDFEANKKSESVAFFLWFFAGFIGAHKFYLKAIKMAIMMLISFCFLVGAILYGLFWFSLVSLIVGCIIFAIIGFIWLADMFCIALLVKTHNLKLIDEINTGITRKENQNLVDELRKYTKRTGMKI